MEVMGIKIVVADGKFWSGRNCVLLAGHVLQAFSKSQAARTDRVPAAYKAVYLELGDVTFSKAQ